MTLNEMKNRPLEEAVGEMNLVKTHIHTDEEGHVCAIELKYAPASEGKSDRKAYRS